MSWPTYFDTHTHLNHQLYNEDWPAVGQRALEAETWLIVVGWDFASSQRAIQIAEHFKEGVYAAVGLHPAHLPHSSALSNYRLVEAERFRELARHPKVVALGEVGYDFHDSAISPTLQKYVFDIFLELAEEFRLPLILHARDAHQEMIKRLTDFNRASRGYDTRGVVHHFTDDWPTAVHYFNNHFLLSLTDLLARSHTRHQVIARAPLSQIVIESECPYLVSATSGPSRPEPSFLPEVISAIARLKQSSTIEVAQATTRNALRIFSKILKFG